MGEVLELQPATALLLPLSGALDGGGGGGEAGGGAAPRVEVAHISQAHPVAVEEVRCCCPRGLRRWPCCGGTP